MTGDKNIITRNFFRLLRSGALGEYEPLEPMSAFKWRRLLQMVQAQHVEGAAAKGLRNHQFDEPATVPGELGAQAAEAAQPADDPADAPRLSNHLLNRRLSRIEEGERHAIDTNVDALNVLKIIVGNVSTMLNHGTMLAGIIDLGSYLRNKGDRVDFVKLDTWLGKLQLRRMAQLQGSMLMAVFGFEQDELPFVRHVETAAAGLVLRSVTHTASDTAEEWHFRQLSSGFVQNNSTLLRRNLRRSLRYITYAPLETVSNLINNFIRSLQEIEE